jgi:hypothetical protein
VINQTTTGEHHMRIWSRAFVLLLSLVAALGAGAANLIAQQRLSGVPVPIAGTTNIGGTFSGTLFIQSFAVQGSVLSGTGVVNGVLNDPTGTRPLVAAQVTVPVDLATARARRNTDVALIAAPCELVHLEFAPAAFIVLGSRVALGAGFGCGAASSVRSTAERGGPFRRHSRHVARSGAHLD